ncbi:hypothetical protein DCCM_0271 [Desulfocucumis palustris]|uniref:Uncharacterized protein n=1 Tax=Desulfocucumis palustris TaxID=1898651 RepID=A0A2L2X7U8_9FIRM|nr:hypothetical protein DCCM_0271 [Desulfocucumis palustris]
MDFFCKERPLGRYSPQGFCDQYILTKTHVFIGVKAGLVISAIIL